MSLARVKRAGGAGAVGRFAGHARGEGKISAAVRRGSKRSGDERCGDERESVLAMLEWV